VGGDRGEARVIVGVLGVKLKNATWLQIFVNHCEKKGGGHRNPNTSRSADVIKNFEIRVPVEVYNLGGENYLRKDWKTETLHPGKKIRMEQSFWEKELNHVTKKKKN